MQITINKTPVWITSGIKPQEDHETILEDLNIDPHTQVRDLDVGEILDLAERYQSYNKFWFCCCLPGCLPDSDFYGPYETEDEALEAATKFYSEDSTNKILFKNIDTRQYLHTVKKY